MATRSYGDAFKRDAVHPIRVRGYPIRDTAMEGVCKYLEMSCSPKRKHTTKGKQSPVDFEIRQQNQNEAGV